MTLHILTPQNPSKKHKFQLKWDGGQIARMDFQEKSTKLGSCSKLIRKVLFPGIFGEEIIASCKQLLTNFNKVISMKNLKINETCIMQYCYGLHYVKVEPRHGISHNKPREWQGMIFP